MKKFRICTLLRYSFKATLRILILQFFFLEPECIVKNSWIICYPNLWYPALFCISCEL